MSTKSEVEGRVVRRRAGSIPAPTPGRRAEIAATVAAIDAGEVEPDLSDIPEQATFADRLIRDEAGKLPRPGFLRDAIVAEKDRRGWSAYQLHKAARGFSPTISLTATTQFLEGRRNVGVEYVEAMLRSLGIGVSASPSLIEGGDSPESPLPASKTPHLDAGPDAGKSAPNSPRKSARRARSENL